MTSNENQSNIEKSLTPNLETLKENVVGLKAIVDSLTEEVIKLEDKKKQMLSEITYNDNLLNEIFEGIGIDNRTFLDKIKASTDPAKPVLLSRNEVFIKRNFRRIKEALEEKSVKLDLEIKRSSKDPSEQPKESVGTSVNTANTSDQVQKMDAENFYITTKLARLNLTGVSGGVNCLVRSNQKQTDDIK